MRRWRQAWRQSGSAALRSRGPVSRERLSPRQWARLEAELGKGLLAHGFARDQRWTLSRIKTLSGKLFHVGYTVEGTWELMRRYGWSCQLPARQALERDDAAIAVREVTESLKPSLSNRRELNDPAARRTGPSALAGRVPRRFCNCDGRSRATPAVEVIAVSTPVMPRPGSHPRKPLLGLRRKPGRLALAMFRMPLRAYRHDAGWLLGHTFLEFTHIGRKTGQPYETVAMVLRYDADTHEAIICAAWGPDTDWVRNLRAGPAAQMRLGRESFTPQHRFLSDDEAFDVAVQFRREHPRRLRLLSTILGWGDLRDDAAVRGFIHTHPFVAFRPPTTSPT